MHWVSKDNLYSLLWELFSDKPQKMLFYKEAELIIWVVSAVGLFDITLILDLWGENKKRYMGKNVYYVGKVLILI